MRKRLNLDHQKHARIRVPFYPITSPTPCDDLYEPDVDYIYVPLSRSRGIYSKIMKDIAMFGHFLLGELVECSELARRVICHFYFPPSGNITHFQPPVTVCPEQCRLIEQLCPEAWASVVKKFEDNSAIISSSGLQFIECDFPGRHLSPLPHCCSDLGLNACKCSNLLFRVCIIIATSSVSSIIIIMFRNRLEMLVRFLCSDLLNGNNISFVFPLFDCKLYY